MAKKRAVRDARAVQEAIATGMLKAKGRGKAKRAAQRRSQGGADRGLMEDSGAFKGGVMRVAGGMGAGGRRRRQ
jgi:hypothetical protein